MEFATFVLWLGFSLIIGAIGRHRNIGFFFAFFWSILLSPLIGLAITLFSKKKFETEDIKNNIINQLEQISNLKEKGILDEVQFEKEKNELLEKLNDTTFNGRPTKRNHIIALIILIIISLVGIFAIRYYYQSKRNKDIIGFWQTDSINLNGFIVTGDLIDYQLIWTIEFKEDNTFTIYNETGQNKGIWTKNNNQIQTIDIRNQKLNWVIISENSIKVSAMLDNDTGIIYFKKIQNFNSEKFNQDKLKNNLKELNEQQYGYISGRMYYPSEGVPDYIRLIFENIDTGEKIELDYDNCMDDKYYYKMKLPVGRYYVFEDGFPTFVLDDGKDTPLQENTNDRSYYTASCDGDNNNHKKKIVKVEANKSVSDVIPCDQFFN